MISVEIYVTQNLKFKKYFILPNVYLIKNYIKIYIPMVLFIVFSIPLSNLSDLI